MIVEVEGASLWTETQGAGVPLVLCHGGPGLSDNLQPVAAMVDDLARVHRYGQRGSGRSRSAGPFDVASFVADREMAELAPRGRWAELEHSSHVPWFEEPARLRELLRAAIIDRCLS